jgi:hypothetical protein
LLGAPGMRVEAPLPWLRLLPSLLLIGAGIALVNQADLAHLGDGEGKANLARYALVRLAEVGEADCW